MTAQLGLDLERTKAARGQASALGVVGWVALDDIRRAIREAAEAPTFTSNDVLALVPDAARHELREHPNAIGASMRAAARAGEIEKTGAYVESDREGSRARAIAVWRKVRG